MEVPTPREKGPGSNCRGGEEEFVLYLQGVPSHCRWQELKDFVRRSATHIRQAVVYDDTGLGQIIVKNEDEAWRTYQRLATTGWEGQPLTVTLARASSPTEPVAGPTQSPYGCTVSSFVKSNPSRHRCHMASHLTAPPSPVSAEFPVTPTTIYPTQEPTTLLNYVGVTDNSSFPLAMNPQIHTWLWSPPTMRVPLSMSQFCSTGFSAPFERTAFYTYSHPMPMFQTVYESHVTESPMDSYSSYRANIYHRQQQTYDAYDFGGYSGKNPGYPGAFQTYPGSNGRSIIIQNLDRQISPQMISNHFHNAGLVVERCERALADDRTFGHSATATVSFKTEKEAERAVRLFDRSLLMGSRIRVRWDRGDAEWSSSSSSSSSDATSHSKSKSTSTTSRSRSRDSAGSSDENEKASAVGKSSTAPTTTITCASSDPHLPLVINGSTVREHNTRSLPLSSSPRDCHRGSYQHVIPVP